MLRLDPGVQAGDAVRGDTRACREQLCDRDGAGGDLGALPLQEFGSGAVGEPPGGDADTERRVGFQNSATASDLRFQAAGFVVVDQPSKGWSTADPAQNWLGDRRFRA